jgi:uncharacterized Zn-binding protein involved in type VI secretion
MAPEQLIRGGIVDHRTDIYAAGVVLFELLTGKRLYEAGPEPDYRALAKKVAKGEHAMPSDYDRALGLYDDLVATALRPKSEDRYQSAAELRDSIQQCLVSVNPTISTDQLGAYMRDLFTEEMTAQRELHERVAKAHLEDFHEQLTTQTGTTVSFAFANLPLQAPPDQVPAPPILPRTTTPHPPARMRPPTAPTDMMPQQPGQPPPVPTAAIPTQELDLADGTGAAELVPGLLDQRAERRSRTKLVAFTLGMIALVAGVVVFAMTRERGDSTPVAIVAKTEAPHHVTVESLPPEPPPSAIGSGSKIAAAGSNDPAEIKIDDPPVAQASHPNHPPQRPHKHDQVKKNPPEVAVAAKPAALTRDAVAAKMSAVKREYDAYKSKNGGRLDGEWGDLAMFVQFHLNDSTLDEVARRIDTFKTKMRE